MKNQSFNHCHRHSFIKLTDPKPLKPVCSAIVRTAKKRVQPSFIWVTRVETIATTIMMVGIFVWAGAFVSTVGAI